MHTHEWLTLEGGMLKWAAIFSYKSLILLNPEMKPVGLPWANWQWNEGFIGSSLFSWAVALLLDDRKILFGCLLVVELVVTGADASSAGSGGDADAVLPLICNLFFRLLLKNGMTNIRSWVLCKWIRNAVRWWVEEDRMIWFFSSFQTPRTSGERSHHPPWVNRRDAEWERESIVLWQTDVRLVEFV